ncbi:MAG TPA: metallophosphoesterase [Actinomycetota bacterium]|nr:metallophosphoesterase [Actinomycetota bacterium]
MPRILALADEIDPGLTFETVRRLAPDLLVSCGDLPFDELERIIDAANVPLVYVPGNHDPDLRAKAELVALPPTLAPHDLSDPGPGGGTNVDGRIEDAAGLRVAGLGGSPRYRDGPNQYTQAQMRRRARRLVRRAAIRRWRDRREVDLLVTHAPPRGVGDVEDDPVHHGFEAFLDLVRRLRPRLLVHGHVHPYSGHRPELEIGGTRVVNVVPHRLLEV